MEKAEGVWSCIQERPSNGVLRVTEVTALALFFFPFSNSRPRRGCDRVNRNKRNKEKRWIRVKGSEFVVTAGTDFIGLSSLFISLLQEVQPPRFHALETKPFPLPRQPLSLFFCFSLSLSVSPLPFWHFYSTMTRPVSYVARIHFIPLQPSTHYTSLSLSLSLHRVFIRDRSYFLRFTRPLFVAVPLASSSFPICR